MSEMHAKKTVGLCVWGNALALLAIWERKFTSKFFSFSSIPSLLVEQKGNSKKNVMLYRWRETELDGKEMKVIFFKNTFNEEPPTGESFGQRLDLLMLADQAHGVLGKADMNYHTTDFLCKGTLSLLHEGWSYGVLHNAFQDWLMKS